VINYNVVETNLQKSIAKLPSDIQAIVRNAWQQYEHAVQQQYSRIPEHSDFIPSVCRAWASSEFILNNSIQFPDMILDLFESGDILLEYPVGEYEKKLQCLLRTVNEFSQLEILLREFRRREMVRIAWRDVVNWTSPNKTMIDLSCLADTIIIQANQLLFRWLSKKIGTPVDPETKKPMPMLVLAMGKLGAYELNFSSDVDLIYCFAKDGELPSGKSYHQFYVKLAQQLTQILNNMTQHGFVFRVDMRLRPYGSSGSLVCSIPTLEDYYATQGREWERYALVKARIINYDSVYSPGLMAFIRNFVYRNYIDYTALESLRLLQQKIELEIKKHSLENNIKRGPGGIREIEFIAQTYKIIRGGKQFRLQERNTLKSLILLRENRSISAEQHTQLSTAYIFLRNVENKLQMYNDKQTHELPADELTQKRIAYAMRHINWQSFKTSLQTHREAVQFWFDKLIKKPKLTSLTEKDKQHKKQLNKLWRRISLIPENEALLAEIGFAQADEVLRLLIGLHEYAQKQELSNTAANHLINLLPHLLVLIAAMENPSALFTRILPLIEAIIKHSIYLVFLAENPIVLSQAINLCAASPWIANELARHPVLLDELLDRKTLYAPPNIKKLRYLLNQQLSAVSEPDIAQKIDNVCWFKQRHVLRVAAADITGTLPLMRVSDYLTDIATVVVDKVRELLLEELISIYGRPKLPQKYKQYGFCIIAYGKLGGIELSYSSDLDLVFLHPPCDPFALTDGDNAISNQKFYTRLGQRLLQTMGQQHPSGSLYKLDLRLRPSGQAGLLVNSVDEFARYQSTDAWTWEHQALVRSRLLCGSSILGQQFAKIRREILGQARIGSELQQHIQEMREKMRENKQVIAEGQFDLKQGRGGLVDIEFIAQYAVLRWSHEYPSLLEYPDNIRIFERVGMESLMRMKDIHILMTAYKVYRSHLHRVALQNQSELVSNELFIFYRIAVARIWELLFKPSTSSISEENPVE
jgi:glutamate-ammonia-ligase adenylyltransferase